MATFPAYKGLSSTVQCTSDKWQEKMKPFEPYVKKTRALCVGSHGNTIGPRLYIMQT
jgi:hypothetical protein